MICKCSGQYIYSIKYCIQVNKFHLRFRFCCSDGLLLITFRFNTWFKLKFQLNDQFKTRRLSFVCYAFSHNARVFCLGYEMTMSTGLAFHLFKSQKVWFCCIFQFSNCILTLLIVPSFTVNCSCWLRSSFCAISSHCLMVFTSSSL